jgi:hypothetical protein
MGNYTNIKKSYTGQNGKLSMDYWVLDYHKRKAENHLIPESIQAMNSLEHWFGPIRSMKTDSKLWKHHI